MGQKNDLLPCIRYHYVCDPEARLNPTHGVWGGINGQGELEACFYSESDDLPAYSEQIFEPDGSLGPEIHAETGNVRNITRNVHTRLVMNYATALALQEWLGDRLAEMKANGAELFEFNTGIEQ